MEATPARSVSRSQPEILTPLTPLSRFQTPLTFQWQSPGRKLVVDTLTKGDDKAGALALDNYLAAATPSRSSSKCIGTPRKIASSGDVKLAQQQVERARERIDHGHLELEVIKEQIVKVMEQLRLTVLEYDQKMEGIVSAESDLAIWRATLSRSGFSPAGPPRRQDSYSVPIHSVCLEATMKHAKNVLRQYEGVDTEMEDHQMNVSDEGSCEDHASTSMF